MRVCPAGNGKGACALSIARVSNIRLRPSPREDIGATRKPGMTLTTCGECNQPVSRNAKTCPGCGAGRKHFLRQPGERRRFSGCAIVAIGFAILIGIGAVMSQIIPPTPAAPPDEATSARQMAAYRAARTLRSAARDPDSLVFESVLADEEGQLICITYRARNGFGGMNRERMTVRDGVGSTRPADWNMHCARKRLYDLTGVGGLTD